MLVVVDSAGRNPFARYLLEILDTEGLPWRETLDLAHDDLSADRLAGYRLVLLGTVDLDAARQATLRAYVEQGGRLIALRPPTELASLFGVRASESPVNRRARDRYLGFALDHPVLADLPCQTVQFHGELDLYHPAEAEPLAFVAGQPGEATGFAAICATDMGSGKAALFAYDLAATVVRLHQGRNEQSSEGPSRDADGDGRWSPNDLFTGQLDARLKEIPQADIHQDLLVRVITHLTTDCPFPRVWYFSHAAPAVAFINGDSDGMLRAAYDEVVETVERFGGRYTVYLMEEHHALFPPEDVRVLRQRGHAFGQHTVLDLQTSLDDARHELARSLAAFRAWFGHDSVTHRGHCLVWPGWTEMAEILAANGVRMDQSFIPRRYLAHGYLNGSGLPVRFVRADGSTVDLSEQNTHITDDGAVEPDKFLVPAGDPSTVVATALRMLDDCVDRYHGVFQASFHPQLTTQRARWLLEAILERCRDRGIPMVNGDEWVRFDEARRAVRFSAFKRDTAGDAFRFTVSSPADVCGLTVMVPSEPGRKRLASFEADAVACNVSERRIKGTAYGLLTLDLRAQTDVTIRGRYA